MITMYIKSWEFNFFDKIDKCLLFAWSVNGAGKNMNMGIYILPLCFWQYFWFGKVPFGTVDRYEFGCGLFAFFFDKKVLSNDKSIHN